MYNEKFQRQISEIKNGVFGDGHVDGRFLADDKTVRCVCFGELEQDDHEEDETIGMSEAKAYTNKFIEVAGSWLLR